VKKLVTNKRNYRLSIAIPASLVSEYANLRDKTEVISRIARSAAIFRTEEIVIYPDQPDEASLIKLILGYIETPQYLRKHLYKVRPELQYAGTLMPLRTPHHQLEAKISNLEIGEFREGVVLDQNGINVVDVGVEKPIRLVGKAPSQGSRVTIKVIQTQPEPHCELAKRNEIKTYWGYEIQISKKSLGDLASSGFYELSVATSKNGTPINDLQEKLRVGLSDSRNVIVAFGSPRNGLTELLKKEKKNLDDCFKFNLNTIAEQGTETIRTEEAIHATLAILNFLT
jgi:methyltransferase